MSSLSTPRTQCAFCQGKGHTDLHILFSKTKHNDNVLQYVTNSSELLYHVHHTNVRERIGECWMCGGHGVCAAPPHVDSQCLLEEDTQRIYDDTTATLDELNEQIAQAEKEEATKKEEYEAAKRFTIEIKNKHQELTAIINETLLIK